MAGSRWSLQVLVEGVGWSSQVPKVEGVGWSSQVLKVEGVGWSLQALKVEGSRSLKARNQHTCHNTACMEDWKGSGRGRKHDDNQARSADFPIGYLLSLSKEERLTGILL